MLVIRIAAITLASDSAITIVRFRPSKLQTTIEPPNTLDKDKEAITSYLKLGGWLLRPSKLKLLVFWGPPPL